MNTEVMLERYIVNELLLGNGRKTIDPDEPLVSSNILDSLGLLRLIVFIEEQFRVTIEDGELIPDNFQTINRIKALIEDKQRSQ